MRHIYKGKAKKNWALYCIHLCAILLCHVVSFAQQDSSLPTITNKNIPQKVNAGLIPRLHDSTRLNDTTVKIVSDTFDFKISKDSLAAPVFSHAEDSMVLYVPEKKIILYGKSSTVKYIDNELGAPQIEYDQQTALVKAMLKKDSTGKVIAFPYYNQGESKMVMDTIIFNMKTGKGFTKGTYTKQGEMYVYAETIKRTSPDIFYAYKGRFTTCNLDTPHFAFVSPHIKFVNKKWAYSGPVHPEFEGVPVPIWLPFGIYPLSTGRRSGLLSPEFTTNNELGLGLTGLGYYRILSPYWDAIFRTEIYSYGTWAAQLNPRYYKRYHYQGSFNLNYRSTKALDQPARKDIQIAWVHSSDNKARPGVSFRANVLAGSSKYNSSIPNDPRRNFNNLMNSSISYSKNWSNKNIIINAGHSQNTNEKLINLTFPDISFSLNTLYPFRRQEPVGAYKWYENLGIGLSSIAKSQSFFYDTAKAVFHQLNNNLKYAASHSVPITLALPSLGPLQVSPSVSYNENWYQQKTLKEWNAVTKKVDTLSVQKGFFTEREISFGMSLSTRIFGMFTFHRKRGVQAIRHEIRPLVSFNFKPNINSKHFRTIQIDSIGTIAPYSIYASNLLGNFGNGRSASMSFSIDNNISMKTRSRKDTTEKKITLLDGLRLDGSVNFLLDSFKFSPLRLSARSNLFNKIGLTASAGFDPYQTNIAGKRIDKLIWRNNPISLGRLTNVNISLQSSFKGGDKGTGKRGISPNNNQTINAVGADGLPIADYEQEAAYVRNNPAEFADFSIPWSIDFSYTFIYTRQYSSTSGWLPGNFNQNATFNASLNLTPKWKLGSNGSYNITTKQLGMLSAYLSRDMHCWQMAINVSPVGLYRFFSISLSPRSPILRDLKVNRTRSFIDL